MQLLFKLCIIIITIQPYHLENWLIYYRNNKKEEWKLIFFYKNGSYRNAFQTLLSQIVFSNENYGISYGKTLWEIPELKKKVG